MRVVNLEFGECGVENLYGSVVFRGTYQECLDYMRDA